VRRREILLALVVVCSAYAACDAPHGGDAATGAETTVRATPARGGALSAPVGCIRSGFTPAEVRVALGEPDSIAGGWWIYGGTQIQLSYGTVQDWIDPDSVVAC